MNRIGILNGEDGTFADALIERLNALGGEVVAAPVSVGGVPIDGPPAHDLVLDLVAHRVPFYRSLLRAWAAAGTIVINDPATSWPDPFAVSAVARSLGLGVPRMVMLPSHDEPPGTSGATFGNLEYPIEWRAVFSAVGFPSSLRPLTAGAAQGRRVTSHEEFFAAYADTGHEPVSLTEEPETDGRAACFVIPREQVHVARVAGLSGERLERHGLAIARGLGLDVAVLEFALWHDTVVAVELVDPDRFGDALDEATLDRAVDTLARWLVRRVFDKPLATAAAGPRTTAPRASSGQGRRVG